MTTQRAAPRVAWDSAPSGRPVSAELLLLALLFGLPATVLTVLRMLPPRADGPALLASFIPAATVGHLVSVVALLVAGARARRRWPVLLALPAAAMLAAQLAWAAPFYVADDRPAGSAAFTLLSVNVRAGEADPDRLTDEAATADVVVLLEATPALLAGLEQRGWSERFGYSLGADDGADTVVWSRYPLTGSARLPPSAFTQWRTTVTVPEVGDVTLFAVHPCNPFCGGGRWAGEHDALEAAVREAPDGPTVVAGDLNAVDDHGPLRRLRALGLRDASDLAGTGWAPTYPADAAVPPLLAIDHVLVDDRLTALAEERVRVPGTDHLGLRARLAGAAG